MTASSVYDTECTEKPRNYDPKQNYFMVGSGNSDKCESLVKSLFDFKNCTSPQCSFNGVEQPPVTGNFLVKERLVKRKCVYFGRLEYENLFFSFFCQAYAGYFFIARALLFNGTSDIDDFNKSVVEFCQTPWKEVSFCRNMVTQENTKLSIGFMSEVGNNTFRKPIYCSHKTRESMKNALFTNCNILCAIPKTKNHITLSQTTNLTYIEIGMRSSNTLLKNKMFKFMKTDNKSNVRSRLTVWAVRSARTCLWSIQLVPRNSADGQLSYRIRQTVVSFTLWHSEGKTDPDQIIPI